MSTDTDTSQDGIPPAGSTVTLLSQSRGMSYDATVRSWDSGDAGLVVSTRVEVSSEAVRELADHRVWVSAPVGPHRLTVFGGIAHPAGSTALDITGVVPLVREQRRQSPRATAHVEVTVAGPDQEPHRLQGIDLSRGGVRVILRHPGELVVGEHVVVEVRLEDGSSIPATGAVTRVDEQAGYAVVRFDDLPSDHRDHIDRFVLFRLTHSAREVTPPIG